MNLQDELLREHSRQQYQRLTAYIGADETRFAELVRLLFAGPKRLTQMAAGLLGHCAEAAPELLSAHLGALLHFCQQPNLPDAVLRNTMRALQFAPVPPERQAQAFDVCLRVLGNQALPVATQTFALSAATRLCEQQPGLAQELLLAIEPLLPQARAALRSRAQKELPKLRRLRLAYSVVS
ncbi:hypothetical protein [Solirubrum puertoriconensis]|uniref:Uncharacterized protein n=1 Tax=Solirubrum puertoriconensis TaxID=1751427 RepID=A0A9X0L476_SOLP1|nr:hypothetical protein [Solirubrum puertoriconensis]KUG07331.1 hypothetical protein ASU33_13315 [Solirubrum puertoriconensis]